MDNQIKPGQTENSLTAILGISAFYHDSAAALVLDGKIVAAAQEERFTRIKNDAGFPENAIRYCLKEAGISPEDLDHVCYYEKPLSKFDRLLETWLGYAPQGFVSFCRGAPIWLKEKLWLRRRLQKGIGRKKKLPIVFLDHHESHAASAFFPSPFQEAAILTLDGVGEWSTTTLGTGQGNRLNILHQIKFPHSLGLLYSAFTYYCGFQVNEGEYKLMGLAPYGKPAYADQIYKYLLDLKEDGSFRLDQRFFNYCQGMTMTNHKFDLLFGGPPRRPDSQLDQRHCDLAASVQAVLEEAVLRLGRHLYQQSKMKQLVLAGGVALNCVANGRLLREGPFEQIWIQPAAGDAGGALGAALFAWYQLLEKPRESESFDSQRGSYLGPQFSNDSIEQLLHEQKVEFQRYDDESQLLEKVIELLLEEKVVGWFQGRMEFGPRALGARSILGDPRSTKMQSVLNMKIKFRESFRPFAPAVLAERASDWFDLNQSSPYMLLVCEVLEKHRSSLTAEQEKTMTEDPDLARRVNVPRSTVPAITHLDYSARVQTVHQETNPRFYNLLSRFHEKTGCPILVNTSMNVRGEPIVCRPEEALNCFQKTEMDALVMENCVITKS